MAEEGELVKRDYGMSSSDSSNLQISGILFTFVAAAATAKITIGHVEVFI
nr:5452_t:CDS:2 [Entrophospora candida]CAG8592816.1 15471_t:CDS:2 [Entrophospora candida]